MSTKTLLLCLTLLLLLGAAAIGYMAFADYRWTKQHRDCKPYTAEFGFDERQTFFCSDGRIIEKPF